MQLQDKKDKIRVDDSESSVRQEYETPKVTVMDDTELLKVFQITSAGTSWWA